MRERKMCTDESIVRSSFSRNAGSPTSQHGEKLSRSESDASSFAAWISFCCSFLSGSSRIIFPLFVPEYSSLDHGIKRIAETVKVQDQVSTTARTNEKRDEDQKRRELELRLRR